MSADPEALTQAELDAQAAAEVEAQFDDEAAGPDFSDEDMDQDMEDFYGIGDDDDGVDDVEIEAEPGVTSTEAEAQTEPVTEPVTEPNPTVTLGGALLGGQEASAAAPAPTPVSSGIGDDDDGYGVDPAGFPDPSVLPGSAPAPEQGPASALAPSSFTRVPAATEPVRPASPHAASAQGEWAQARQALMRTGPASVSPQIQAALERDRARFTVAEPRVVTLHRQKQEQARRQREAELEEQTRQRLAESEERHRQDLIRITEDHMARLTETLGEGGGAGENSAQLDPESDPVVTATVAAGGSDPAGPPEPAEQPETEQPEVQPETEPESQGSAGLDVPDEHPEDPEPIVPTAQPAQPAPEHHTEEASMSTVRITTMLQGYSGLSDFEQEFFLARAGLVSAATHTQEVTRVQEMAMGAAGHYEAESIRLREAMERMGRVNAALRTKITELSGGSLDPDHVEHIVCTSCAELTAQLEQARAQLGAASEEMAGLVGDLTTAQDQLAVLDAELERERERAHALVLDEGSAVEQDPGVDADPDPATVSQESGSEQDRLVPEEAEAEAEPVEADPDVAPASTDEDDADDDDTDGEGGSSRELSKGADDPAGEHAGGVPGPGAAASVMGSAADPDAEPGCRAPEARQDQQHRDEAVAQAAVVDQASDEIDADADDHVGADSTESVRTEDAEGTVDQREVTETADTADTADTAETTEPDDVYGIPAGMDLDSLPSSGYEDGSGDPGRDHEEGR